MPKTIRPPNFVVPRMALMTWAFAAEEDTARTNLKVVRFEKTLDGPGKTQAVTLHAIATDGHRLIHVWWDGTPEDILDEGMELEASAVDLFLKELNGDKGSVFGRGKKFEYRICSEKDSYALVAERDDGTQEAWVEAGDIKHSRGDYPQWRTVMPKWAEGKSPHPMCFGVNLDLLMDYHRFLKEFGFGNGVRISYQAVTEQGAMLVLPQETGYASSPEEANVEYVLMPMRL